MILPEDKSKFVIDSNLFINKFVNRKDITREELNYIQYTVYNKYNINDPLVINFFNVFSQICFEIINNDTIKTAFNLPENVPNYRDQKIVQAYNNTIYPYHTIINEFIYASVYGYATNIKKVIELCKETNKNYDFSFMNQIIDYFEKTKGDIILDATTPRPIYYPLEFEINEYSHLNDQNHRSMRYEEFVKELKAKYSDDDPDLDFLDEKKSYKKLLTGRIGETLYCNEIHNKEFFIYSAKDVGNHTGFDASYFENIEQLREIKSTFEKVDSDKDVFFVGSTERTRISEYLKSGKANKTENYKVIRVFLNENYKIEYVLFLDPVDEHTFIDKYHNVYEQDENNPSVFTRKKMISKC